MLLNSAMCDVHGVGNPHLACAHRRSSPLTHTQVSLGGGVFFSAANIPGECRPFGFEKYWQKKAAAQDSLVSSGSRRLDVAPTSLWILSDDHKTNPVECRAYVRSGMEEGSLFDFQSEHTSIQIRADDLAIRVNHGKIHQLAMRDPTDQYNLPDHIAFQMNIDFERFNIGDNPQVWKPQLPYTGMCA